MTTTLDKKIIDKQAQHWENYYSTNSETFGIGWGMVGFCPGPAISSLALLNTYSVYFVLSMLGGFLLTELVNRTIIRESKINYD